MCIIIDTNFVSDVFRNPESADNAPIISWLFDKDKDGIMVYGGSLAQELFIVDFARRAILILGQAGRAIKISDDEVNQKEQSIVDTGICKSNDQHIIALAQVSGARTLCSHDEALHNDFKNKNLIDKPRGSIYQYRKHSGLLKHTSGCRKSK